MAKRKNFKKQGEMNNFQDAAMDKEFDKGMQAAQSKSRNRERNHKSKRKGNGTRNTFNRPGDINSSSWYVPNDRLLKDVASYPFGRVTGYPLVGNDVFDPVAPFTGTKKGFLNVPGVLSLYLVPTFGPSPQQLSVSPLNIASQSLFSYVRHANSGAANYESNDLMLYVLSVSQVISYYAFLCRIYGVATSYQIMNRYTPNALLAAMQVDAVNIQSNLADLRAAINLIAYRLQTLVVPKGINYIDRQVFLYENIFMDANNAKAQYYMYNPVGFYIFSEGVGDDAAGKLTFTPIRQSTAGTEANRLTVSQLIDYANALLDPILGSQDFNEIIAGDILKAFQSNVYQIPSIAENYQCVPIYNQEILSQIENATIYNGNQSIFTVAGYNPPTLSQATSINSSTLQFDAEFDLFPYYENNSTFITIHNSIQQKFQNLDHVLNFHKDSVMPEDVMVASRLMSGNVAFSRSLNTVGTSQRADLYVINTCGSEIVYNALIYYYALNDSEQVSLETETVASYLFERFLTGPSVNTQVVNTAKVANRAALMTKFDWNPRVTTLLYGNSGTTTEPNFLLLSTDSYWDIDNFTKVSDEDLYNLHNIAVTGLFSCRDMSGFSPK